MIDVSTAMEVDQRLQRNLCLDILFLLCSGQLFRCSVEAVDVSLMMVLVMELHDLAGNGGLESAVVIYQFIVSKNNHLQNKI